MATVPRGRDGSATSRRRLRVLVRSGQSGGEAGRAQPGRVVLFSVICLPRVPGRLGGRPGPLNAAPGWVNTAGGGGDGQRGSADPRAAQCPLFRRRGCPFKSPDQEMRLGLPRGTGSPRRGGGVAPPARVHPPTGGPVRCPADAFTPMPVTAKPKGPSGEREVLSPPRGRAAPTLPEFGRLGGDPSCQAATGAPRTLCVFRPPSGSARSSVQRFGGVRCVTHNVWGAYCNLDGIALFLHPSAPGVTGLGSALALTAGMKRGDKGEK